MKILVAILTCAIASIASADNPWMFPVDYPSPESAQYRTQFMSATTSNSFIETADGSRPFDCTTRIVDVNVASFREIVKWYSEKFGEKQLVKNLESFMDKGDPEQSRSDAKPLRLYDFESLHMARSTHFNFRFTPEQRQITILHAEKNGDVVAISLLGNDHETSIQVIRHSPPLQALAQKDGEPRVAR